VLKAEEIGATLPTQHTIMGTITQSAGSIVSLCLQLTLPCTSTMYCTSTASVIFIFYCMNLRISTFLVFEQ